jgi:hypothetical protein
VDHFRIPGHVSAEDADLRAGAKDLTQLRALFRDGSEEAPRPGTGQRWGDAVDPKAIGIGFDYGGGLHTGG